MLIGIPKEIKNQEHRVGLSDDGVREVIASGHQMIVETQAGAGISCSDDDFREAGAEVVASAEEVFSRADMIVKVKEPQASEIKMLRPGQILFTYLHLAPDLPQTQGLVESGAICVAYETVTNAAGRLPLLAPMSKVAGRMAVQAGAYYLEHSHGGLGMLLGGVPGVDPAKVVILGAGIVGNNAAHIAVGMGAEVWVVDRNVDALDAHWQQFGRSTNTVYSTQKSVERHVLSADLVIAGILIPGAAAPKLVTASMVKEMKTGSVLVDVAIDQGGCAETSRPTTHDDPVYIVDGVVHYCVANMPGGVPRTSTFALTNSTLPFVLQIANKGIRNALLSDPHLLNGLNVCNGKVTIEEVARAHGMPYHDPRETIAQA